jgi:hypothetical protein
MDESIIQHKRSKVPQLHYLESGTSNVHPLQLYIHSDVDIARARRMIAAGSFGSIPAVNFRIRVWDASPLLIGDPPTEEFHDFRFFNPENVGEVQQCNAWNFFGE